MEAQKRKEPLLERPVPLDTKEVKVAALKYPEVPASDPYKETHKTATSGSAYGQEARESPETKAGVHKSAEHAIVEKAIGEREEVVKKELEGEPGVKPLDAVIGPRERCKLYSCCMCKETIKVHDSKKKFKAKVVTGLKPQDVMVTFALCGCKAHYRCFSKSCWSSLNNETVCPVCSEPRKYEVCEKDIKEALKKREEFKATTTSFIAHTEEEKKALISALLNLLLAKRQFKAFANQLKENPHDYTAAWRYVKSGNVTFDEFMALGWNISQMYHYLTTDLQELKKTYGFKMDHLKYEEIAVGMATVYNVNVDDLKKCFEKDFTFAKLKELALKPITMKALGITTHQLIILGMRKTNIRDFPHITMTEWVKTLDFAPIHIRLLKLKYKDFSNKHVLARSPDNPVVWTVEGLTTLLNLTPEEVRNLGLSKDEARRHSEKPRQPKTNTRYTRGHGASGSRHWRNSVYSRYRPLRKHYGRPQLQNAKANKKPNPYLLSSTSYSSVGSEEGVEEQREESTISKDIDLSVLSSDVEAVSESSKIKVRREEIFEIDRGVQLFMQDKAKDKIGRRVLHGTKKVQHDRLRYSKEPAKAKYKESMKDVVEKLQADIDNLNLDS